MYEIAREACKKYLSTKKVRTVNLVFSLYTTVTVSLLGLFAALLGAKQYFGEPISCWVEGVPKEIINPYCWITGTHTNLNLTQDLVASEIAHPGIGFHDKLRNHKLVYHVYYQWVALVLLCNGAGFYLPRFIWKRLENRTIENLISLVLENPSDLEKQTYWIAMMLNHFSIHKVKSANFYAMKFFLLEFLNPIILLLQIYCTDLFLGENFIHLGIKFVCYHSRQVRLPTDVNPFEQIFPKVTSCNFKSHGSSGGLQNMPSLCVLPLNNLNEKIYLFLWFWYSFLLMLSVVFFFLRLGSFKCFQCFQFCKIGQFRGVMSFGHVFQLNLIRRNVSEESYDLFLECLEKSSKFLNKNDRTVHLYHGKHALVRCGKDFRYRWMVVDVEFDSGSSSRASSDIFKDPSSIGTDQTSLTKDGGEDDKSLDSKQKTTSVASKMVTLGSASSGHLPILFNQEPPQCRFHSQAKPTNKDLPPCGPNLVNPFPPRGQFELNQRNSSDDSSASDRSGNSFRYVNEKLD